MSFKIGLHKFEIDLSRINDKDYLISMASRLRTLEDKFKFYNFVYSL